MNTGKGNILSLSGNDSVIERRIREEESERRRTVFGDQEAVELIQGDDLENINQMPLAELHQLTETFFGINGSFRPYYSHAQATKLPASRRTIAPLGHSHIVMLTHDCVLHFWLHTKS